MHSQGLQCSVPRVQLLLAFPRSTSCSSAAYLHCGCSVSTRVLATPCSGRGVWCSCIRLPPVCLWPINSAHKESLYAQTPDVSTRERGVANKTVPYVGSWIIKCVGRGEMCGGAGFSSNQNREPENEAKPYPRPSLRGHKM
jgi:hypothetical protein